MLLWTPTGLEPASRHPTKGPRAFRRSPAGLGLNAPPAQVEAAGAFLDPDGARTRFPASHERPEGLSQEPCRPRIERAFGAGGGSGCFSWTPTGLEPASRHPTKGPRAFRRSPAGLGLNAPSAQVEAAGSKGPHLLFQNKSPQPYGWGLLFWSGRRGSNPLPPPWQGGALPDELRPQNVCIIARFFLLVNYNFTFSSRFYHLISAVGASAWTGGSSASKISTISAVSRSG